MTEHKRIALKDMAIAPENARAARPADDIDGLAANIASHGLLQPLVGYMQGKTFMVTDGRRRLAALRLTNAVADAPCIVRSKADARAVSIAANTHRTQMHPADEARAWVAMAGKGAQPAAIANAFGVTERHVLQRLKLGTLHAPILEALAKNEISIDVAEAYASAPDARQAALWKTHGKRANRWSLRRELEKGKLPCDDPMAIFVGEEAYVAAGGRVERDLFARPGFTDHMGYEEDGEAAAYWLDRAIAEKCMAAKLEGEVARIKKEGWGWVEFGKWEWGRYGSGSFKSKADKSKGGAFVSVDSDGKLQIRRGLTKAKGAGRVSRAPPARPLAAKAAPGNPPPLTNRAHEEATAAASMIVGRVMMDNPRMALAALAAHLARAVFKLEKENRYLDQGILRLRVESETASTHPRPPLKSDKSFAETFEATRQLLAAHRDDLEGFLFTLALNRLDELLAFLTGCLVDVIETRAAEGRSYKERRGRIASLARRAGVNAAAHYAPEAVWLRGMSGAELEKAARALGARPGKTKSATAARVAIAAADKGWIPPLVGELCGAAAPAQKPPPAKKAARKASAKKTTAKKGKAR